MKRLVVAAILIGCNSDPTFYIFEHEQATFALGTRSSIWLLANGRSGSFSGGRLLDVETLEVTASPGHFVHVEPEDHGYVNIDTFGMGAVDLTIEARVEDLRPTTITHRITVVPARTVRYVINDIGHADLKLTSGTVLGRGLHYRVSRVDLEDAAGQKLLGFFDHDKALFLPRAGELYLRAPPGATPPKIRFADVRFDVEWTPTADGIAGTLIGTAPDGAAIQLASAVELGDDIAELTPERCTVSAHQHSIFVQPVEGGSGPCRINLLLARVTAGHYADQQITVPMPT